LTVSGAVVSLALGASDVDIGGRTELLTLMSGRLPPLIIGSVYIHGGQHLRVHWWPDLGGRRARYFDRYTYGSHNTLRRTTHNLYQ
jgi:hypothetical protein